MIKELVKIATRLDAAGLTSEADQIDRIIRKIAASDKEDFNRRNDAFYEKMKGSGTPMSPMGEHRPYMHELYPSSQTPRKPLPTLRPKTQEEFDHLMGPADEYGDIMRRDILNQSGAEPERFSERLHGESYEMDEDQILGDIDEDREFDKKYPAKKRDSYYDKYNTEEFDKEASRRMRGMRKRAGHATRESAPKIDTHLIRGVISERADYKLREANKSNSSYEMGLELKSVERLHSFLNSAGDKVYITTNDNSVYSLWLEDPLDPLSKADPRKPTGISVRITAAELADAIGRDHLNMIKGGAREAGYIEDEVMKSGYGKWQFTGDTSELDMMGYTPDVLK